MADVAQLLISVESQQVSLAAKRLDLLTQAANKTDASLTDLQKRFEGIFGNSQKTTTAVSKAYDSLTKSLDETNKSLRSLTTAIEKADFNNSSKAIDKNTVAFNGLNVAVQGVVTALAGFTFADAANDVDKSIAKTAASMGIAREEAKKLTAAGRDVYKQGFGESLDEINTTFVNITKSAKTLGITTTDQAAQLTKYAQTLTDVFGSDTEKTLDSVTALTKEFGLTGQQAFDFIAKGYQSGLDKSGDFLDSISEYSNQFAENKFTAAQFFSAMETGMKGGVLGTDKVTDAFKEFGIRIRDGSDTTEKALAKIGINVNDLSKKMNSGQLSVADAFTLVQSKMAGLKDETVKFQVGAELMGAPFEDLGSKAFANVNIAKTSLDDLKGAMDKTLTGNVTASQELSSAWRTLVMTFAESDVAQNALYGVASAAKTLAENLPFLIDTATTAAVVLGTGGLLYKGIAAAPAVMTATSAAVTVLSRSYIALTAGASASIIPTSALERVMLGINGTLATQTSMWGVLTANLYGTSVAAQWASGAMGKLQVAGGLAFAAFAGWEIGSYLYKQFDIAKVAGLSLFTALAKGWVFVSEAAKSPIEAIKTMFSSTFNAIQETFIGMVQGIVSLGEYLPGVSDQFKELNSSLQEMKTSTTAALMGSGENDFSKRLKEQTAEIDDFYNSSMENIAKDTEATKTASGIKAEHVAVIKDATEETKQQTTATQAETKAITLAIEETAKYKDLLKEAMETMAGFGKTTKEAALVDLQTKYGKDLGQTVYSAQQASDAIALLRDKKLELQQVGLNDSQKAELQNTQEYNAAIAKQVTEIDTLITRQNALIDARNELNYAGLSQDARGYVDLMKELGVETAKTVIQMQQQASLKSAGVERISGLQEEITLLKMSSKERDMYNQLKDVSPDQRPAIKALLEEKTALEKNQKQWEALTDSAVDYLEKVATGELSFKDALKGFAIDFNKEQIKESMTKLKESITGFFSGNKGKVTLDAALGISDAKMSSDVQAASKAFEVYKNSLNEGTKTAVSNMTTGIDASIAKMQTGIETALKTVTSKFAEVSNTLATATKDAATAATTTVTNASGRLGALSEKYESGRGGAGTVSSGKGDPGGVSYGKWQISSKAGSADEFVNMMKNTWAGEALKGLKAGSAEFSAKWKELAAQNGADFEKLQYDYIKKTHYDVTMKALDKIGVDLSKRSDTLKDVVWSTSVQHRNYAPGIISEAMTNAGGKNATDEALIKEIYALRGDVKKRFASSSEAVQEGVKKRMINEEKDALAMLKNETQGLANAQTTAKTVTQQQTVENQKQVQQTQQKSIIDQQQQFVDQKQLLTTNQNTQATDLNTKYTIDAAKGAGILGEAANKAADGLEKVGEGGDGAGGGSVVDKLNKSEGLFSGGIFDKDGALSSVGDMFRSGGTFERVGKFFSSDGALSGLSKTFERISKTFSQNKAAGGSALGIAGSAAMSLIGGDIKGAIGSGIAAAIDFAMPGVGTAVSMVMGPVMNKLWGQWTVESQHLTTAIDGLTLTNKIKTIEVNKGLINGGKRTSYADLDPETQKQQQAFFKGLLKIIDDVGTYTGKKLTEQTRYKGVSDVIHADVIGGKDDNERAQNMANRLYSIMVKNAFTEQAIAGVDVTLPQTMTDRVQNLMFQAADGLYDKALQDFLWKPDTAKYADALRGPIQQGINDIIATTDFSGMSFEDIQSQFSGYLETQFKNFGIEVPADTWQSMADDLAAHVQDGLTFLSNAKIIDPDAGFFKQAREIVDAFNVWDLKPEEVKAFIDSLMGLKDAFKLAGFDASQITKEMADALNMDFSGLSSGLSAYYDNFLTEEEQRANKQKVLNDDLNRSFMQLGVEMPKTKDGFKTLVETMSKDITDPQLFAGVVQLSEKAAEYYDLIGSTAKVFADASDGIKLFATTLKDLRNAISAQDVQGWLSDSILNASNAQEAGLNFSNAFASAFQQQMLDTVLSTVSNMVFSGLVQPMLDASVMSANNTVSASAIAANQDVSSSANSAVNLTSGSTTAATALAAGGQIAASYIASVVENVKQVITVMSAVMKDESIKTMMKDIQPALQTIGAETYTAVASPQSISAPYIQQQAASKTSSSDAANAASDAATETEKEVESLDSLRKSLKLFGTGLKDTELKLYELNDVFKNADLSMIDFSGSAESVANSLNALNDDQLAKIAADTGISIDELEGYAMDYLNLRRDEVQAVKEWQKSFEDNDKKIHETALQIDALGVSSENAIDWLKQLSPEQVAEQAKMLGLSTEQAMDFASSVVDGLKEISDAANEWKNELDAYTKAGDKSTQTTKALTEFAINQGLSVDTAVSALKTLNPQQIAEYAKALDMTESDLMSVVSNAVDGLKAAHDVYDEWQKTLNDTSSETIKQTSQALMNVGVNSKQAADFLKGLSFEGMTDYAEAMGMSSDKAIEWANNVVSSMKEVEDSIKSWKQSLNDESTLAKDLATTLAQQGLDASKTVAIFQNLDYSQISAYAEYFSMTADEVMSLGKSIVDEMRNNEEEKVKAAQDSAKELMDTYTKLMDSLDDVSQSISDNIAELQGVTDIISLNDLATLWQSGEYEKAIERGDKYRQQIVDAANERVKKIEDERDKAKSAYDDQVKAYEDYQSKVKDAITEINGVGKDAIDVIKDGLDSQVDAINKAKDTALDAYNEQLDSLKELRDSAKDLRKTIADDMKGIRKSMGLAPSLSDLYATLSQTTDDKAKYDLITEIRDLELESLNTQIDKAKEKYDLDKENAESLLDFAKELRKSSDDLALSNDLSVLTSEERYKEAQRQFEDVLSKAQSGDKDAQQRFSEIRDKFLTESRAMFASSDLYTQDYLKAQQATQGLAGSVTAQAENIKANIPLDDTEFAKVSTDLQSKALDKLAALDAQLGVIELSVGGKIDASKFDESVFAAQIAQANADAVVKLEQLLTTPPPQAFDETQFTTLIDSAKQNAVDQLNGLQAAIDMSQQSLTTQLSSDLLSLGAQFGLNTQQTIDAVKVLGSETLGPRLDNVVTALNSGLSQVAASVGGAYTAVQTELSNTKNALAAAEQAAYAAQSVASSAQMTAEQAASAYGDAMRAQEQSAFNANPVNDARLAQIAADEARVGAGWVKVSDTEWVNPNATSDWLKNNKTIPSYDVGTNLVPSDQLAMLHKGEAVVPKEYNQGEPYVPNLKNNQQSNEVQDDAKQNEIVELLKQFIAMQAQLLSMMQATSKQNAEIKEELTKANSISIRALRM